MNTKTLKQFIDEKGAKRAALIFGVKPRTVVSWYYGARQPRTKDIPTLIARSGGELSVESFFDGLAA